MRKVETKRLSRRRSVTTVADLSRAGIIESHDLDLIHQVAGEFSVAITPEMVELINPKDVDDPIGRQFVPSKEELDLRPEEMKDPIGDERFSPVKGVVHRYPDRVLLKPLHVCSVYCRFCFRRENVGNGSESLSSEELDRALDYIREDRSIWEVILSGGDPLLLSASRLAAIADALSHIRHVKVLRIHTRIPVVDPMRITRELIESLAGRLTTYVVLHCNHPRELTESARRACARLVDAGFPMLSQSVLLKGVNDQPEIITALMRALVEIRVKPYYLHHADLARGTSHFRTTIRDGQAIVRQMRGRVSGLCQPTYVLDIPGGHGKVPIGPSFLHWSADGTAVVTDFNERQHSYRAKSTPDSRHSGNGGQRKRK